MSKDKDKDKDKDTKDKDVNDKDRVTRLGRKGGYKKVHLMDCKIGEEKFRVILDNGADEILIGAQLANRLPEVFIEALDSPIILMGAGDMEQKLEKKATNVIIKYGEAEQYTDNIECLIAGKGEELILGQGWMNVLYITGI